MSKILIDRAVVEQALESVQEFKRRWWMVPAFGNKVNKATREAITNAHSPIFELDHALRAALAQQPAEPVAWIDPKHLEWLSQSPDNMTGAGLAARKPKNSDLVPLYTAPQPAKREPLTEAQICSTLATAFPDDAEPDGSWKLAQYELGIFRLAERAHGIGETK